jgi:hypothetical protein
MFGDSDMVYKQIREMAAAVGMELLGQKGLSRGELETQGVLFFG